MISISSLLKLLLLFSLIRISATAQIPAFPGAEGFGATTPGGRGGKVIKVTNLNDHGPGSLRAALSEEGTRIIVFTTGGIINLETKLVITEPYLTIAGQTAPGGGICLRGEGIQIDTHDVVVRYLRIRPGDIDYGSENNWGHVDAISVGGPSEQSYNIVIDHCSLSWSVDENMDFWYKAHDVTVQYCIIAEALNHSRHPKGRHGMGVLIGGDATRISMHHNLLAHNEQRNPKVVSNEAQVDIRNNVIYNPGGAAVDIGNAYHYTKRQQINLVGNTITQGKNTHTPYAVVVRQLEDEGESWLELHVNDNIGFTGRVEGWEIVKSSSGQNVDARSRLTFPHPFPAVTTHSAQHAYNLVLAQAGAVLPDRDAVDRKIVRDLEERKGGTVNRRRHLLQWPPLEAGTVPLDADYDGMPDTWEQYYHFDSNNISSTDTDQDGYTDIEEYINGTNPVGMGNIEDISAQSSPMLFFQPITPSFTLSQNYPNPFNDRTEIKFSIPKATHVSLRVIDNQGIVIDNLLNHFLYEGSYHIAWDSSNAKPGIYYLVLGLDGGLKHVKAILSRN